MSLANKLPIDISALPIGFKRNDQKILTITRSEDDELEICKPKIVRTQHYLFFEKTTIVHLKEDGIITMEQIKEKG